MSNATLVVFFCDGISHGILMGYEESLWLDEFNSDVFIEGE